jgi:multidrug resistance efflux pump/RNAse (barnase) inhibitor barstar
MKTIRKSKFIKENQVDSSDIGSANFLTNSHQVGLKKRSFTNSGALVEGSNNKSLTIAWTASLAAVLLLLLMLQSESGRFFGIVEGKQQSISFQYPVNIVDINVVEGQIVKKNQGLLKVRRNDLESKLAIIEEKISEVRLINQEFIAITKSKVKSLVAEQKAKYNQLSTDINRLETRHKLNTKLQSSDQLSSTNSGRNYNVLVSEIRDSKASRWHTNNAYQAKIDNLNQQLNSTERPVTAQLAELAKRKSELVRQQSDLSVSAHFLGGVGSILYKPGETVEPFRPIITLHSAQPDIIKGYIHESILNTIDIGQTVWVKSLGAKIQSRVYQAEVKSLGSRMVEYPERLRRDKNILAFGREVVIKLAEPAKFLMNEKVVVTLDKPSSMEFKNKALSVFKHVKKLLTYGKLYVKKSQQNIRLVSAIDNLSELKFFEASGITSLNNSSDYIVISDENVNAEVVVAVMNRKGELTHRLPIANSPLVDDIESISQDGEYIYLSSSLSHSKNGVLKKERCLFLQLALIDGRLVVNQYVDLYERLVQFAKKDNVKPDIKRFLTQRISSQTLETESHFVHHNQLFVGFKSPIPHSDEIVIVKIFNLNEFIKGKITEIEIWKKLRLELSSLTTGNKGPFQSGGWFLTDMAFRNGELYLLTVNRSIQVSKSDQLSALWKYTGQSNTPSKLLFEHRQAEGVFIDQMLNELVVVFDEGNKKQSRYFRTNLLPQAGK